MTDELTPEEQKAFDSLPRERMPVGLESRVVAAMREHGFLAKRRRTVEVSHGRVAGLLAACFALMIGAYSIGLHRGDGGEVVRAVDKMKQTDSGLADKPLALPQEQPVEKERKDEPPASAEGASGVLEEKRAASVTTPEQTSKPRGEAPQAEALKVDRETTEREVTASPQVETPAPASVAQGSALRSEAVRDNAVSKVAKHRLTFMLNGSPVVVDADSVRITEGQRGRMLIIYTSDGIIRIPLADVP